MTDRTPVYSREELARIRSAVEEGREPDCPRCAVALVPRPVLHSRQVSYVRRRDWYLCPSCGRSAVLDR